MENLKYLIGAYFHEDWYHQHESWQDVVDDFLGDNPNRVRAVPDEIDALLISTSTTEELDRQLASLGCAYDPAEGYRAWLEAVRDRIAAAVSG